MLKKTEKDSYTVIDIKLDTAIIPDILKELTPPKVDATKGVVLSGRAPVWLYGFLVHHYHYTTFVATYDPRVGGAIVVESHCKNIGVGDII